MSCLTSTQLVTVVELIYKNNNSIIMVYRLSREDYEQFNRSTERPIRNIVQKFEGTESIGDRVSHVLYRGMHSVENIAAVVIVWAKTRNHQFVVISIIWAFVIAPSDASCIKICTYTRIKFR